MRRMRTWLGPPFRGEGLVGNSTVRRFTDGTGGEHTERQLPEDVIPAGVVELRVHGVNGGTPEQNLHDPSPVRIAGDDTAGFYRRREELASGPERVVEAYNWSAINSRKSIRAWWLLLFPFASANFAGWLLPKDADEHLLPKGRGPQRRVVAHAMVRLISLCVTVLAALGLALVFVDLIGVQCAGIEGCTTAFTWGWVGSIATWGPIGGSPVRLAMAYSLVPAVGVLVLWLLGRRSRSYEEYGAGTAKPHKGIGKPIDEIRMDRVEFWQAPDVVYVQAWLHGTVAITALAAVMAFTVRELVPDGPHYELMKAIGVGAMIATALGAVAVVLVYKLQQIPPYWMRKRDAPFWKPRASWIPAAVAIGLYAAVLWFGWISNTAETAPDVAPLEAVRNGLIVTAVVAFALVFALACLTGAGRTVAFSVVAAVLLIVTIAPTDDAMDAFGFDLFNGIQWLVVQLAVAAAGIVVYALRAHGTPERPDPGDHRSNPTWIYGTTALLFVFGIAAFVRDESVWLRVAAVVIPLAYLGVQFVTQISNGHDYPEKESMREGVAAVMAGLGVAAMLTFLSSGAVFVAQRLGQTAAVPQLGLGPKGNACPADTICYPAEIGWFALSALAGFAVLIFSVVLRLVLLKLVRWRGKAPDLCADYDAMTDAPRRTYDLPGTCQEKEHVPDRESFAKRGVSARWLANVTDDADWLIGAAVYTTLTLILAAAFARWQGFLPDERETTVFGFASWAVTGVIIAIVFLVWRSRESRQLRETLGILWDVMSFFPRRFHPLAPPCYAERAVIDVRNRVIHATSRGAGSSEADHGDLILVAHSEGTLISTAALLSLLPDHPRGQDGVEPHPGHPQPTGTELDRVRFVTYGCMLQRLYGRAWPDQLSESTLIALKSELEGTTAQAGFPVHGPGNLARWINFGRYSDYLGGRVFQELQRKPTKQERAPEGDERCDDVFFIDPTRRWRYDGQLEHARIWRHSFDYESDTEDPRFREHIWATARVLNGEAEAGVVADYPWMDRCPYHEPEAPQGREIN